MKAKSVILAGLVLLAFITLSCAPVMAQEMTPGLVGGVTWDTTPEEILQAEGITGMEDLLAAAYTEEGTQISLSHFAEGEEPTRQFFYAYQKGKLMAYGCAIVSFYQAEGADMAAYYDMYLRRFAQAYGDPAEQDRERIDTLLSVLYGEDLSALTAYAGWDLGDDTILFHINADGMNIMYMYISESRMLSPAEETAAE